MTRNTPVLFPGAAWPRQIRQKPREFRLDAARAPSCLWLQRAIEGLEQILPLRPGVYRISHKRRAGAEIGEVSGRVFVKVKERSRLPVENPALLFLEAFSPADFLEQSV